MFSENFRIILNAIYHLTLIYNKIFCTIPAKIFLQSLFQSNWQEFKMMCCESQNSIRSFKCERYSK